MRLTLRIHSTLLVAITLISCAAGHQDYIDARNNLYVGRKMIFDKYKDAGQFYRGDYVIVGQGLTRIDTNSDGKLIYHVFEQEILPNTPMNKEWIGKCLVYYVVDPQTKIVLSWGFDEGGNPLACRSFQ